MNTFLTIFPLLLWIAIFGGIIFWIVRRSKRKSSTKEKVIMNKINDLENEIHELKETKR